MEKQKIWIDPQLSPIQALWINQNFAQFHAVSMRQLGLRDATDKQIYLKARQENAIEITYLMVREIKPETSAKHKTSMPEAPYSPSPPMGRERGGVRGAIRTTLRNISYYHLPNRHLTANCQLLTAYC